ncbi:thioredoxin family protein [Bacillus testis]|uniref:thioredoxin family protein n=1 Tax=Bacillus testis TaxID=1622072 RepID=UPI00067F548C|nr:thioredoxin family protein [Bacillus testis]
MDLRTWFDKGYNEQEYIDYMQTNKDNMLQIKEQFTLHSPQKAGLLKPHRLRALVLTADWCGDAMVNLPVFMAIAHEAGIEARYLIRDENLDLMDQYLTNGTARSIPIIILADEEGNEVAKWGPRAPSVQQKVTELRAGLPAKDDPAYEEAFKSHIGKMRELYVSDPSIWREIEEDMLQTFAQ